MVGGLASPEARFLARVEKRDDGCWRWLGALNRDGYGRIGAGGRYTGSHRFAYERFVRPIPPGLSVCHRCDRPWCVNPEHLFLGTQKDNMRDCSMKGRAGMNPNPRRKLSVEQVLAIRHGLATGVSGHLLAKTHGVTRATIHNIGSRKKWRWL